MYAKSASVGFVERLFVALGENRFQELEDLVLAEHGTIGDFLHVAVDPPPRFVMCGKMQIRRPLGHHLPEKLVELGRARRFLLGLARTQRDRMDPGMRLHHVVEERKLGAHRVELHARNVLPGWRSRPPSTGRR